MKNSKILVVAIVISILSFSTVSYYHSCSSSIIQAMDSGVIVIIQGKKII